MEGIRTLGRGKKECLNSKLIMEIRVDLNSKLEELINSDWGISVKVLQTLSTVSKRSCVVFLLFFAWSCVISCVRGSRLIDLSREKERRITAVKPANIFADDLERSRQGAAGYLVAGRSHREGTSSKNRTRTFRSPCSLARDHGGWYRRRRRNWPRRELQNTLPTQRSSKDSVTPKYLYLLNRLRWQLVHNADHNERPNRITIIRTRRYDIAG